MSKAETEFDRWMVGRFDELGPFTMLMLLIAMPGTRVDMIACTWLHVVGSETRWREMRQMLDQSGKAWDAVALFAERTPGGGPLIDVVASARLQSRIDEVTVDRMLLNDAGFFDVKGRAIRIDPLQ